MSSSMDHTNSYADGQNKTASTQASMQEFSRKLNNILAPYKSRFEALLVQKEQRGEYGPVDELKRASLYALSAGGKRFRPAIVWMVSEALGKEALEKADNAALAVEYFHNSSLIADDLPCMDNDDFRRGVPTTHKAFSESTALLASFSLIALGFQSIAQSPLPQSSTASLYQRAILEASRTMGSWGLIGGQAIDLFPPNSELKTIEMIIDMKTVALFDLSFSLGWLFGGGAEEQLDTIHDLSRDFGRAFQILDDLDDLEQDTKAGKAVNFALQFGTVQAIEAIEEYVERTVLGMKALGFYQGKRDNSGSGQPSFPLIELCRLLSLAAQSFK